MNSPTVSGLSRRDFIARAAGGAALVGFGGVLAACGGGGGGSSTATTALTPAEVSKATGSIKVLGWQFYEDDKAYNAGPVKASWSYLSSEADIWTKSRTANTFDVINSGNVAMPQLFAIDRIAPLDTALLQNYPNILRSVSSDSVWKGPDGKVYGVPLALAVAQPSWDSARVAEPKTLTDLLKPELEGAIGMLNESFAIQLIAGMQGVEDPGSLTKAQLEDAMTFLEELAPQIKTLYQFGEEAQLFARGDIAVALPSFGSVIIESSKNGAKVKGNFFGSYSLVDSWSVTTDGDMAASLSWIDETISAAGQEGMTQTSYQVPVVPAAAKAMPKGLVQGSIASVVTKAPVLGALPLAETATGDQASYEEVQQAWEQFAAGLS